MLLCFGCKYGIVLVCVRMHVYAPLKFISPILCFYSIAEYFFSFNIGLEYGIVL